MQRLYIISNYKGHTPSDFKGRITRISGNIVHIQIETGRFIAFNRDSIMFESSPSMEGEEVEVTINRPVPAST